MSSPQSRHYATFDMPGSRPHKRWHWRDVFVPEIRMDLAKQAAALAGHTSNRDPRIRIARATDSGPTSFENPGLLGGDRREVVTQLPRVIERDARDDRQQRPHHVRGIKPPSQADFKHDCPYSAAGEMQQSHRRGDLEKRGTR